MLALSGITMFLTAAFYYISMDRTTVADFPKMQALIPQNPAVIVPLMLAIGIFTCILPYFLYTLSMKVLPAGTASAFAEKGLGISKTLGDLAGPMMFAVLMGVARAFYGKYGDRINLDRFMIYSSLLCVVSYLVVAFAPHSLLSLAGCAMCGIAIGIMWPGTLSKSASMLRNGGTAMFALLAVGGDLGCSIGPTLVGTVADRLGGNMKLGIFTACIFPVLLAVCLIVNKERKKNI